MNSIRAQLILAAFCLLFGVLLMTQYRTQVTIAKAVVVDSPANQAQIIANLYDNNVALRQEVEQLEVRQQGYQRALAAGGIGSLVADLNRYRVVNGLIEARGQGVELVVSAAIRAEDMQDLINEFRNAGAEALAINDQRVVTRTSVRADMGGVLLSGAHLDAPYRFQAIGSPDILERALTRKGGMVSYLTNTYPQARIVVEKRDELALPVVNDRNQWRFARPVK